MKLKHAGPLFILLFILGSLSIQPVYGAPPEQAGQTDWLTYENTEYGYQIKYPPDWSAEITLKNQEMSSPEIVIDQRTAFRSGSAPQIAMDVWRNDSNKSLQAWFEAYQKPLLLPGDVIPSEPNARIANEEAFFSVEFYDEKTSATMTVLLAHGEYIYRIEYYALDSGQSGDIYREMLRSLQFSDNSTDSVSEILPELPALEPRPFTIQENSCCGYSSSGNPYTCWGGNCVWWAYYKRPDTGYGNGSAWGNARNWDDRAIQEGFTVKSTPAVGAIAVSNTLGLGEPGSSCNPIPCGHVAYVKDYSSTTVTVSEMNYYEDRACEVGYRIRDNHPYQRSHFQNYIYETPSDTIPPTTTASLSGTRGESNWYRSNVQVTLSAQDNSGGSGVKLTQYKIDSGTWQTYSSAVTVSGQGNHTVAYKSQDNAGNWESEKQITFGIDTTGPTGSLTLNNGSAETSATTVLLQPTASDALSGLSQMRFRQAGGVWSDWLPYAPSSTFTLTGNDGDTLTVEMETMDRAGNLSAPAGDSITLTLYPDRPASTSYRLVKSTLGTSGFQNAQSTNYRLSGTLGQPSGVSQMSDGSYRANLGYWGAPSTTAPPPLQASFTANPIFGFAPLTVNFTNTSAGGYTSSSWNFGDGNTGTATNPSHAYTTAGTYTVSLTITGPGGSDTVTRTHYISVDSPPDGPILTIPANITAYVGQPVQVPIQFNSNNASVASTAFSVDFDETCLLFDETDANSDGQPDAVSFNLPGQFSGGVSYNSADTDGELDFTLGDYAPPLSALPDQTLATITFTPKPGCKPADTTPRLVPVTFAADPAASFGSTAGASVAGSTVDGSVAIQGVLPGDANGDGKVDAGDISALVLEIFDGDGNLPGDTPGGTFPGTPGADANQDGQVDAGDISCTVLLIFNGPGACGTPDATAKPLAQADGPQLTVPAQLMAAPDSTVTVPITYTSNSQQVSSIAFSIDFDQSQLTFDDTDANNDQIPDRVTVKVPAAFGSVSVTYDAADTDGELDIFIGDVSPPLAALADGELVTITFGTASTSNTTAAVNFSTDPTASFGSTSGQSVAGDTHNGIITITETTNKSFIFLPLILK